MTREQRKRYHKRCAIQCISTAAVCFAIVYGVSYLVNVVMRGAM